MSETGWARICPRRMRAYRLATSPQTEVARRAWKWVHGTARENGETLLIFGPTGTGKTGLAVGIMWEAYQAEPGDPPVMINAPEWLEEQRPGRNLNGDALRHAQLPSLLVVDDLGAELQTDWALERWYLLFNDRYVNERATVVTTNLASPDALAEAIGERLMSRIGERATIIHCGGDDLRLAGGR